MATFFLDYEGGNDANDGTTFANRWKTITSGATAARIAPGDTIRIMGSPAPTSLGINGTFTQKSATVTLASALNALIDNCDTAWTASANVTSTADAAIFRTSTKSAKHAVAGAFTTGLASFFATGTLNLSAYQGITLWIRVDTVVAGGSLSIRLCSDAAGVTTVDNLAIPAAATSATNGWYPVYIDKGSALGASIASIALYVDTDLGAGTVAVYLDNISAVKAVGNDNLNLQSLIGTNGANETWWAIRGINGTTVTLDESPAMTAGNTSRGYYSVNGTQTVTAYKRETIKLAVLTLVHNVQDSGTAGNLITFSGGWNRTDMTTQTLDTWWDGCTGVFNVLNSTAKDYIKFTKVSGVRGFRGIAMATSGVGWEIPDGHFNNNGDTGIYLVCTGGAILGTLYACANTNNGFGDFFAVTRCSGGTMVSLSSFSNRGYGFLLQGWQGGYIAAIIASNNTQTGVSGSNNAPGCSYLRIDSVIADDNAASGVAFASSQPCDGMDFRVVLCRNNSPEGLLTGDSNGRITIGSLTTSGNVSAGYTMDGLSQTGGQVLIYHSSIAEATKNVELVGGSAQTGSYGFNNYLGIVGNHLGYLRGANARVTTELAGGRHSPSGIAWTMTQVSSTYQTSWNPMRLPFAKLAVKATRTYTVSAYFKRTNVAYLCSLVCPGYQIAGVPADVVRSMTAIAGVWEQLTITFTPTADGVVTIEAQAYGGLHSVTIDDLNISRT